ISASCSGPTPARRKRPSGPVVAVRFADDGERPSQGPLTPVSRVRSSQRPRSLPGADQRFGTRTWAPATGRPSRSPTRPATPGRVRGGVGGCPSGGGAGRGAAAPPAAPVALNAGRGPSPRPAPTATTPAVARAIAARIPAAAIFHLV